MLLFSDLTYPRGLPLKSTATILGLLCGILCACLVTSIHGAEPATYFRSRGGLPADDQVPLPENLEDAKALLWRVPIATGHSTPCVHGDGIYVTTFDNGKLFTIAFEREAGKVRWTRECPAQKIESVHSSGSPATSSPACDGERVYAFFGSYGLLCYDLAGSLVWDKPLGPFQDEFGAASSPILWDGKLIINEDHDLGSYLLCLDATTGKELWRTPREDATRSYSTPVPWTAGGKKQVLVAGALQLIAYDLETGKQQWTQEGLARIMNTTPAIADDLLIISAWSPGGDSDARIAMEPWAEAARLWDKDKDGKLTREEADNKEVLDRFFRIDLNQDQGLDEQEWGRYSRVFELARNAFMAIRPGDSSSSPPTVAWTHEKGIPYIPSPLAYRGIAYLVKDGGIVSSFDVKTGELLKTARCRGTGTYFASPVAGDGKVYLASEKGVISVLRAGGEWETLSSRDLAERTCATPVLHEGKLFVRTEVALYCFGR